MVQNHPHFSHLGQAQETFPLAIQTWNGGMYDNRVSLHWHNEIEIIRFVKGDFDITVNMHDFKQHDAGIVIFPSNSIHTMLLPKDSVQSSVVFDPKIIQLQSFDQAQSDIAHCLSAQQFDCPPMIPGNGRGFKEADELLSYVIENADTDSDSVRLKIKLKLLELLSLFYDYGYLGQGRASAGTDTKNSKQEKLKQLLGFINHNYAQPLTITDAARRLNVTEQYFCRYFKKVTSMSFTEYLNDLRLSHAADDIRNTNKAISEIYLDHGFENSGYFFKTFKKKYKITPLQYRKQIVGTKY